LLASLLISCATLQSKWKASTEQEKAQIILGGFQDSLNIAFDAGKLYVTAHPDKLDNWRTKIIPMFDATNKILGDLIKKGQAGTPLTVLQVTNGLSGRILEIQTALTGWGVILK
jgi:hypothetical protein